MERRRTSLNFIWAAIPLALGAAACAGHGGASGTGGSSSGTAGGPGVGGSAQGGSAQGGSAQGGTNVQPPASGLAIFDPALCPQGQTSVGASPVRRLSRVEYNNIVRDLGLGDTHPADQFVAEQKIPGNFNTNAYADVSGTLITQQYLQSAETIAESAVTNANTLTSLLPSSGCGTRNAACAQAFIASFANRAFRGQLDSTESAALLQIYTDVSTQFDFATGIQAVITAVLTSPRFLYVMELGQSGAGGAVVPLAPMEVATRLSLFLWRSLPDQTLTDAANGGQLATADCVSSQATRMLADPKATGALQDFANQWLDIENMDAVTKDTQFAYWTPDFAKELHTETLTTFSNAVTTDNGDLPTLLTSSSSYVNADLVSFYNTGAPGTALGTTYTKMAVGSASAPRAGILTHASVLSTHAHTSLPSPTLRGRMVRQQVMCDQVQNPPAQVNGAPIPPPPTMLPAGSTTRAQYMQHFSANTICNGCHQWMDLIGFGFDNYDATGKWITQENGTAVDASGSFVPMQTGEMSGTFQNATDMIGKLGASMQVKQCFALQEMRYALGRVEENGDACSVQQAFATFSSGSFNLKQLLVAIVSSDSFRNRSAVIAGSACQ
jgi:hypothetical protein